MSSDWMRSCVNRLKSSNLDVRKLGVDTKSIKIVLHLGTIQFDLHVPLIYYCPFGMD